MKVILDKDNKDKVVTVYCSPLKGTIKVVYIDEITGREIKVDEIRNLPLGEHDIDIVSPSQYQISSITEQKKEEVKIKGITEEFNIDDFAKEIGLQIEIGDKNE